MTQARPTNPWPGLWALIIGFFMLLVDTTIVSVANPAIKAALDPATTNLDNVVWVTSAYLLTFSVPLLIAGRLGDAFGPKRVYLTGLAVFALASLGCGLSTTLGMLVAMRAVQGLGAALMSPQSMALIARTFEPRNRGAAMGLWGATAGVATLVGPLAGGFLVDAFGWQAIFYVNLPVGVIGFVLAAMLVPRLETHPHKFDVAGIVISAVGLFLLVFGLQEGEKYDWGVIWGPISVWSLIIAGVITCLPGLRLTTAMLELALDHLAAGTARLVGTDRARIVTEMFSLLDDSEAYSAMAKAHNPFGDGTAGTQIARIIADAHRH